MVPCLAAAPMCGEDELADLTSRNRAPTLEDLKTVELYYYRCGMVTVRPGDGLAESPLPASARSVDWTPL